MSSLVGGIGIIGQDIVCGFGNGKYKTFEGTEIVVENCVKAKVKDLVVEGKTIQDTEDLSNIESVAEREENLVNIATVYESMLESGTIGSLFNPKSNSAYDVYKMEIQPNTEYLFNLVGYGQTPWVRILDKNNITVKAQNLSSAELNYIWSLKTKDDFYYLVFNKPKTSTGTFQIYKTENPYPLKLKINEEINYINLPIPLRSLPNGTCDTIEGNKLVQRVGVRTLDGTEGWTVDITKSFIFTSLKKEVPNSDIICDNLICGKFDTGNCIWVGDKGIGFWLDSGTGNVDKDKSIKWLQENPVTVFYELATPIIHDLEVPSISTKGTNTITTTNNIKPKLKLKVKVKK